MTITEAEEYFKENNVANLVYRDVWTEDTVDAIAAITDAFHSGKTLRDVSDVSRVLDAYVSQIMKAPLTEKTKGARDAFLIAKKLVENGVPAKNHVP